MIVILHQADWQTPHVGVVLVVVGHAPLLQVGGPGLQRQREPTARNLTEGRKRDAVWRRGWRWRRAGLTSTASAAATGAHPDTGEVDLAVSSSRRWRIQNRLAVFARHIGRRIGRPLRKQCRRQGYEQGQDARECKPQRHYASMQWGQTPTGPDYIAGPLKTVYFEA